MSLLTLAVVVAALALVAAPGSRVLAIICSVGAGAVAVRRRAVRVAQAQPDG
jgi:hypothetical protein